MRTTELIIFTPVYACMHGKFIGIGIIGGVQGLVPPFIF